VDDAELTWGAVAGKRAAWAEIYDRYADRLHDYCYSILRDRQESADALHEAFLTAATKIGKLRDPGRLRPWLYAICRTQALAMAPPRSRELQVEDVDDLTPPPGSDYEARELRRLVWNATDALAPKERAVLALYLRHGMDGQELGEVLNVRPHHATLLLSRVRDHAERSLRALLVSQSGRADCPFLNGLLVDWDGSPNPLLPKRVVRHIDSCPVCGERSERMVSPLALLSGVPLLPAPPELREAVLDGVELRSSRQAFAGDAGDGAGDAKERTERRWPAAVAGVLVALILVGALVFAIFKPEQPLAGPPSPSSRSVTSGPAGPSSLASAIGPQPTLSVPATTSTTTTHTTTTRTTQTTTTTTDRPDSQPPEISNVSTNQSQISFKGGGSCSTAEATARVTDQSSLNVVLVWQTAGGDSTQRQMSPRPGNRFTATIGPVQAINDGPIRWWVIATDSGGSSSESVQQSVQVVATC
jgi:RNA polymerase sigma factor (sigma-70 family)